MKSIFSPFFALGLVCLLAFSCKEPEPFDPGDNQDDPTKGTLVFNVYDSDNDPLEGVLVGLTPNQADRDNGIFLRSGQTDAQGRVKFEVLEPLTYYYNAAVFLNNQNQNRQGRDSVGAGEEIDIDINF